MRDQPATSSERQNLVRLPLKIFLTLALLAAVLWFIGPAFRGFHVGYNAATDNACISHVLQWCGHDSSLTATSYP